MIMNVEGYWKKQTWLSQYLLKGLRTTTFYFNHYIQSQT